MKTFKVGDRVSQAGNGETTKNIWFGTAIDHPQMGILGFFKSPKDAEQARATHPSFSGVIVTTSALIAENDLSIRRREDGTVWAAF